MVAYDESRSSSIASLLARFVACARLGYRLVMNMVRVPYNGGTVPAFKGEIRKETSGHHNCKDTAEIVEIRKARCREVYDMGVADEPHLFALASGILTHNSKPNPMPESVTDRPTQAHEHIFLLAKSPRYYYDQMAIAETAVYAEQHANKATSWGTNRKHPNKANVDKYAFKGDNHTTLDGGRRNKRSVWTVATQPFPESHFATYPIALIKPCILAGCPIGGTVLDPFMGAGTTGLASEGLGREYVEIELNADYALMAQRRIAGVRVTELENGGTAIQHALAL